MYLLKIGERFLLFCAKLSSNMVVGVLQQPWYSTSNHTLLAFVDVLGWLILNIIMREYVPCTDKDMQVVEKNVRKKSLNTWYEAQLLTDNGKTKRVYCYISPRVRDWM
jgi:hypothetical protein